MYLRFGAPIDTTTPLGVGNEQWVDIVKERTGQQLEAILADLRRLRGNDPYRGLNPLAWHSATTALKVPNGPRGARP
jgi:hypothetical protein